MGYGDYLWYEKAKDSYSYGDAFSYQAFTLLSGATSFNIISYLPWEFWDKKNHEWSGKAYTAMGLGVNAVLMKQGLKLFNDVNLSFIDGCALSGGTLAGGLVGSAGVLLTHHGWKANCSMILAGGWLGYGLTYNLVKHGKGSGGNGNSWLQIYPENLATLWLGKSHNQACSASLITVSF